MQQLRKVFDLLSTGPLKITWTATSSTSQSEDNLFQKTKFFNGDFCKSNKKRNRKTKDRRKKWITMPLILSPSCSEIPWWFLTANGWRRKKARTQQLWEKTESRCVCEVLTHSYLFRYSLSKFLSISFSLGKKGQ